MHPDILNLFTDIKSDGLSTIPEVPNTLTFQSNGKNDAIRDPLHCPVTHFDVFYLQSFSILFPKNQSEFYIPVIWYN